MKKFILPDKAGQQELHNSTNTKETGVAFTVQGQVQGVGFRPFVWRLANELAITGSVRNTSAGVRIEAAGFPDALAAFEQRLVADSPPLARICFLARENIEFSTLPDKFSIEQSMGHAGQNVLVSPDVGICQECLEDIRNPDNLRFGYAFTNCVNCGPRYSITKKIPYDRPATVMSCFPMCAQCASEYASPADRRFHAQPIACPDCGPKIWYVDRDGLKSGNTGPGPATTTNALGRAGQIIMRGGILALKGLGGFQLVCNARDNQAVAELRARKNRPHKALAVMADRATLDDFCAPGMRHAQLLESPEKPIVLCPKLSGDKIAPLVAPDVPHVGVMLPNTPLHALLLDWLANNGLPKPVLVMTSANPCGEPICLGNREALHRLEHLADAWLLHNRDILVRVDDSVVGLADTEDGKNPLPPIFIRRARGYVPSPIHLVDTGCKDSVLGTGAHLKATFCLTRGNEAFVGQHIGDMESPETMEFYTGALEHLQNLLEIKPDAIVHDAHPDFMSTRFAIDLGRQRGIPVWALQHHAAHAAAALAENEYLEPALALCLDGTGLGEDGTIWGGELLRMDLSVPEWQRLGGLAPFPLPGGEMAIREPWRIALGFNPELPVGEEKKRLAVLEMLRKNLHNPLTSSCGRLFDAVAAMAGLISTITHEGQAAMRLMNAASRWFKANPGKKPAFESIPLCDTGGLLRVNTAELFDSIKNIFSQTGDVPLVAAIFHHAIADSFARLAQAGAKKTGIRKIALSGGVMQNSLLACLLPQNLADLGLSPLLHKSLPPGDGGLSFGQAVWGRQMLRNRNH